MSDKIPIWLPIPDAELKIQQALKLQKLVKKRIKKFNKFKNYHAVDFEPDIIKALQSLIEESEK